MASDSRAPRLRRSQGPSWRTVIVITLALAIAACGGRSVRVDGPKGDGKPWSASQTAAPLPSHWLLEGRLAISNGKDSGSGRIDWRQEGTHYDFRLRAPVSGQNWQLLGDDRGCQLQGLHAEPVLATSPEELLRRELGWELPVAAMRSWLFGQGGVTASIERNDAGNPVRMTDAGWTIEYRDWQVQDGQLMPKRVIARRAPFQVRLAITRWQALPITP